MIGIVNYGMGNLASVKNACDHLNITSKIIDAPNQFSTCDKIILPGVGAFGMAMENLCSRHLSEAIKEFVLEKKKPILGICLGMQLLLETSIEHGVHTGLGIIPGEVLFLGDQVKSNPIPHMGWNDVQPKGSASLFKYIEQPTFYFVHSFYCALTNYGMVAGETEYEFCFHSSIEHEHVFGCQFHPEKSHNAGLTVFNNFNLI